MLKNIKCICLALFLLSTIELKSQYDEADSTFKKYFVGTSLFVFLGNFDTKNPPNFFQLDLGYRITGKDIVRISPKTWKYAWPNGIHPFLNDAYYKPEEKFPGYVREYGVTFSYQRFIYEGWYAQLDVMPTLQSFVNDNGKKIDDGFQLFNSYRVGYHFKLFNDKFFIQPSICVTHRAYHTELPTGFKELDDKWSKFIFPEPGINIGYNF